MKKYLQHIMLLGLPVLLLAFPLDYWFSHQLSQSKSIARGEIEVWNDIYEGELKSEILVFGSSRAWNHFDPMALQKHFKKSVYNVGIDGYDFGMQYFRHQEILKHNDKPQTIILSLDVFMFEHRGETYNSSQFLPFMFLNSDLEQHLKSYEGFRWTDFHIPLLRFSGLKVELNEIGKRTLNNPQETNRVKGFKAINQDWNNDLQLARAKLEDGIFAKIDPRLTYQLDQFLSESKTSNIEVILVFSPEFLEGQEFVQNRNEVFMIFDEMAKKYNLQYLNYSQSKICEDQSLFFNSNHLNQKGVTKFNELLLNDLMN